MEAKRVLVSGTSNLQSKYQPLVESLGTAFLRSTTFTLVTGGLAGREGVATDKVFAHSARAEATRLGVDPRSRIVTMLPQKDLDSSPRDPVGDVWEIALADSKARRYSMVLSCDALISVGGADGTKEIMDLAVMAGKPVIPLAVTGASAMQGWQRYRELLAKRLALSKEETAILDNPVVDIPGIVELCQQVLNRCLRPYCFIAMPIGDHPMTGCIEAIKKAVSEKGYAPVRIDEERFSGSIVEAIWDAIRGSDCVIGDLTGWNPNVFYEIGISHALGKKTVLTIYNELGMVPPDIPFDVRVHRVQPYGSPETLTRILERHLTAT